MPSRVLKKSLVSRSFSSIFGEVINCHGQRESAMAQEFKRTNEADSLVQGEESKMLIKNMIFPTLRIKICRV